jgi:hypothetical protein
VKVVDEIHELGLSIVIIKFLGIATDVGSQPPPFLFTGLTP